MNKIKTVIKITVIGAGIVAVIDKIRLHKRIRGLEERIYDIGHCHNDFCLLQERYNRSTDEQIESIQDEIGSVYEHIEELSKDKEDRR
ncbi:MAG: conjugal transfer protein [Lagierella massiliensis]|nr:conjugal transfer protein [Lagierella massiliensis]